MVDEVSDEVVGFGLIEFQLKDPSVTEVMVANGPTRGSGPSQLSRSTPRCEHVQSFTG